jgi:SAM-dependent methyltransferase
METYNAEYYEFIRSGARASASVVVPLFFDLISPKSVIDVGCGSGEWLALFAERGVQDILGVEHPGFDRSILTVPGEVVVERDLREPLTLGRVFDLAVSLEVAEHLPPQRGEGFVEDLCQLAPVVLFSAAVAGQGDPKNTGHLNERWQSYWASLFYERGYERVDCVRPAVWEDSRVKIWYRQNTILYVSSERLASDAVLRQAQMENAVFPVSVCHPEYTERYVHRSVTQRKRRKLQKRIKRLKEQLEAERSKGLLQRIFRGGASI